MIHATSKVLALGVIALGMSGCAGLAERWEEASIKADRERAIRASQRAEQQRREQAERERCVEYWAGIHARRFVRGATTSTQAREEAVGSVQRQCGRHLNHRERVLVHRAFGRQARG